ncbi:acetate--CoA ligase family protein [Methanocaldococcus indicus]|uniref:acetate--CoA ligase family protein n=1 Tax=Methanocaldococcus indicus TaxID=213231 RepID=UPI003C6CF507
MIKYLFYPESIAIIGATPKENKVGYSILNNLKDFKGKIYPINPKYSEILGYKCYKSILDVDDDIDLAVIVTPNVVVPNVLEECGKKGVKAVVIITAGFSEVGNYELENKIKEIAKKYNITVVGPNCLGIINTSNNLNASFSNIYPPKGNVAIISQSGAVLNAILDICPLLNIGVSKVVSLGNNIMELEGKLLEYLNNDNETKLIAIYLEGLKDKNFKEIAKKVNKPIIVLKSGKSEVGKKAAKSHTGSLAGEYRVYKALFKQLNFIIAETFEELIDLIHIFSTQPTLKSNNIAIITNAGGFGVLAADYTEKYNLKLPNFSEETVNKLKEVLPKTANISNPLDIIGDATPERYRKVIEILSKDKNIDAFLVILTPQKMTKPLEVAKEIVDLNIKPLITSFVGGISIKGAKSYLRKNGYPSYITPENGVKALSYLYKYSKKIEDDNYYYKVKEEFLKITDENKNIIRELLKDVNEYKAKKLLSIYNIPVPKGYLARSEEEAEFYAKKFDKCVMKIVSPEILHKSDIGGVIINPENPREAYRTLIERAKGKKIEGVLVEEYIDGEKVEVIVGSKKDDLGYTVMVGLGGIFVEVLKDISLGVLPISKNYAINMIKELKSYKILEGYRGQKKKDINFIAETLIKIGVIAEINNIKEIEINPLFVFDHCGIVGDARIII